jgi:hypothetical protein
MWDNEPLWADENPKYSSIGLMESKRKEKKTGKRKRTKQGYTKEYQKQLCTDFDLEILT